MVLGAGGSVSTIVIAVVVVAVVLLCIPSLLAYIGARQRSAVHAYAAAQGWEHRDNDPGLATRYTGPPFVADPDARAESVIDGTYRGLPFAAYAYTYRGDGSSGSGTTHTIPVVALGLESGLPDLEVTPVPRPRAGPGERWPRAASFAEAFTVRSADDAFAAELLTARLTHALMAFPDRAWGFREGDLVSVGSWDGSPERIVSYLDHLGMVLEAVPDWAWDRYGDGHDPRRRDEQDQPKSSST